MPYPKGINRPEVRAAWIAERRALLARYDALRAEGVKAKAAAAQLGVSLTGIHARRASLEALDDLDGERVRLNIGRVPGNGIDLGLAVLGCLRKPGEALGLDDIAAWCGCSRSAIWLIEQRALRKVLRGLRERCQDAELAGELNHLFGSARIEKTTA